MMNAIAVGHGLLKCRLVQIKNSVQRIVPSTNKQAMAQTKGPIVWGAQVALWVYNRSWQQDPVCYYQETLQEP